MPAVLTPLASDLSEATSFSIQTVVMTQVVGFSTVLFPYQAPSILIGLKLDKVRFSEAVKICLYLALISIVVLMPLNYFWWQILGWL